MAETACLPAPPGSLREEVLARFPPSGRAGRGAPGLACCLAAFVLALAAAAPAARQVLEAIRYLLESEACVETEGSRVRFARLGASSLDIDVFAYVQVATYPEFLGVQEELLLRILEIVERAEATVAFPTQIVSLRAEGGPELPKRDRSA